MRPFCIATIGAILGIMMGLYLKSIALLVVLLILTILSNILIAIMDFPKKKKYITILLIFSTCLFLFCNYILIKENTFAKVNQRYAQKEIEIQAIVITDKIAKEYKDVYQVQVTKIKENEKESPKNFKMIFNLKRGKGKNILLEYGDEIHFKGIYEKPNEARNEGGFDYEQYLKTKNILGITTVKEEEVNVIGKNKVPMIAKMIHAIRRKAIEKIKEILPKDTANLCTGLLIGDKTELSEEIQDNFRKSNLSHMLAISGAHVSYILLGITTFIQKLKLHKRWGKVIVIFFFIFFMALTGFTPSVVRSCIMVILQLLASILFRKSDTYQNLAISCFVILLSNPYALLDIGFQLSFGGTIGIVIFSKKLQRSKDSNKQKKMFEGKRLVIVEKGLQKVKEMCLVTLSANLVIIPIMMYYFNTFSLTFFISNLLASHVLAISLILGMVFLALLFITPLAKLLSLFLHPILQILIEIAKISSRLPLSQILVPTPAMWQIILYYLFLTLIMSTTKFWTRVLLFFQKANLQVITEYKKVLIMILLFLIISPYILRIIPSNKLTISFVDVGQGDCMLIQTPFRKTILIDGGGSETGSFDIGGKTLIPYLLDRRIMKIDYMIFSHFDSDHCQGLLRVMEKLKVMNAVISKQGEMSHNYTEFLKIAKERNVKVVVVQAGDRITVDKQCYLSILFPKQELIYTNVLNNNSVVAKIVYQPKRPREFSLLLTGDVEAIAERQLIKMYQGSNELQADVLKIAHHRI